MKSVEQIKNLKNKRVLLRVDFNVKNKEGEVEPGEIFKIKIPLPTIKYLLGRKAKVILLTHLGRPGGKIKPDLRSDAAADCLSGLLKKLVRKIDAVSGVRAEKEIARLKGGEILMLENVRFEKGEEENNDRFGKELARLGDFYVNDAFAVCHRPAASVAAIAKYLPAYAGFSLLAEIKILSRLRKNPKKPLLLLMGGLKFETKLPVMEKFLNKADQILVGGGLAATCWKALGFGMGASVSDDRYLALARKIVKHRKIRLPIDVIVGRRGNFCDFHHLPVPPKPCVLIKSPYAVLDIGPATIQEWAKLIKKAKTIIWNGPMGYFEQKPFETGTLALARLLASRAKGRAFGVAGGGETVAALERSGMAEFVDHISAGGGALLEFLAGKKLPGIEALN